MSGTLRALAIRPWLLLVLALAAPGSLVAAPSDCAKFEALGLELTGARDSHPAAAVERGEKALLEAAALRPACPTGEAMLLGGIASNLSVLGRHNEAARYFERALQTLGESGTPTQIAFLHRGIGVALVELESYQLALKHYLIALEASDAADESIESAKTAGNIGILYTSIGELELARDYHGRALAGFEKAGFKPGIAGSLVNLGSVAAKFGQRAIDAGDAAVATREHHSLRELNERAQALFAELGNQRGVAYAESNIGLALDRLGHPLQALPHHQHSLALRRAIGDKFGTVNSLIGLAATMTSLQRYDEAAAALVEADGLVPAETFALRKEVAATRVNLAETRGDYPAALAAQRDVTRLAALGADADQLSKIAALQDRFDADHAAKEIDLLRSEARLGELQLQRERQVTRLSMLVAALAVVLFLVLFSRYRVGVSSARKLTVAARTDHLTDLPNRRHLLELMEYEVSRVARGGRPFCLLMADLDDFKHINDRHGHDAGDAVLRETAHRLRHAVRKQDSIARWGGEEFLFLLPESDKAGALILANKLRERISAEPFLIGTERRPIRVTLTLGLSEYQPGMDLDDCIKAADSSLYQGKQSGKNRIEVPSAAPEALVEEGNV